MSVKIIMDHVVDEGDDGDIFIYRGGRAPQHVTHVLIDKSLDEIVGGAFDGCVRLVTVETHDGIRRIGRKAFQYCTLRRINLKSVVEIELYAFFRCRSLESVEFGDKLERIGNREFSECTSLKHLKLPTIITIGDYAFHNCTHLIDVELSERLETIGFRAFWRCKRLQRIAIPLKRDLFVYDNHRQKYNQFDKCDQLTTVDLVGGTHKTVASLHMERGRTDMIAEINRINQVLPNTPADEKTAVIKQWMDSVLEILAYYVFEHCRYVREGIVLLELALWKARLGEKEESSVDSAEKKANKANVDVTSAREESRMLCGADIVIKNVLPFLRLEQ